MSQTVAIFFRLFLSFSQFSYSFLFSVSKSIRKDREAESKGLREFDLWPSAAGRDLRPLRAAQVSYITRRWRSCSFNARPVRLSTDRLRDTINGKESTWPTFDVLFHWATPRIIRHRVVKLRLARPPSSFSFFLDPRFWIFNFVFQIYLEYFIINCVIATRFYDDFVTLALNNRWLQSRVNFQSICNL